MTYRAEIDGLRALAVVPVILFHAGADVFGGGFLGVDVFFEDVFEDLFKDDGSSSVVGGEFGSTFASVCWFASHAFAMAEATPSASIATRSSFVSASSF